VKMEELALRTHLFLVIQVANLDNIIDSI